MVDALGEHAAIPELAMVDASDIATFDDAGPTTTSTCESTNSWRLAAADAASEPSSRITISTGRL
jgi:hypothetical protein